MEVAKHWPIALSSAMKEMMIENGVLESRDGDGRSSSLAAPEAFLLDRNPSFGMVEVDPWCPWTSKAILSSCIYAIAFQDHIH